MTKNLKEGLFTQQEMLIYGLEQEEINIVLVYQYKYRVDTFHKFQ